MKQRFYHGLSHYFLTENWIAYLCGKLFWSHFSAIVIPDDLLKHQTGLCSQQTIVYMEILNQKGIINRKVGMADDQGCGHFLTEVRYNNSWHLYDVNLEPNWEKIVHHHESIEYYKQNHDTLYRAYEDKIPYTNLNQMLNHVEYGKLNEFPAKNMALFHRITKLLTYFFPALFLALTIYFYRQSKHRG